MTKRVILILGLLLLGCGGSPGGTGGRGGSAIAGSGGAPAGGSGGSVDEGGSGGTGGTGGVPVPCSDQQDRLGTTTRTVGGRTYLSYAPSFYQRGIHWPVVLALHGAGDTSTNYLNAMWKGIAEDKRLIVVVPEGASQLGPGYTWSTDDHDYILSTLDDIYSCYDTDPKKTIIHGFSAGGIMAYWIGLKDAQRFSGIAIDSADLFSAEAAGGGANLLPAPWKIPVSHFHGDQDPNFPISYAQAGINRLEAAGHTTFFHIFHGGHTVNAQMGEQEYDDLSSATAP